MVWRGQRKKEPFAPRFAPVDLLPTFLYQFAPLQLEKERNARARSLPLSFLSLYFSHFTRNIIAGMSRCFVRENAATPRRGHESRKGEGEAGYVPRKCQKKLQGMAKLETQRVFRLPRSTLSSSSTLRTFRYFIERLCCQIVRTDTRGRAARGPRYTLSLSLSPREKVRTRRKEFHGFIDHANFRHRESPLSLSLAPKNFEKKKKKSSYGPRLYLNADSRFIQYAELRKIAVEYDGSFSFNIALRFDFSNAEQTNALCYIFKR